MRAKRKKREPALRITPHARLETKEVVDEEPYSDEQEYHPDKKNEPNVDAIHHLLPFGPPGAHPMITARTPARK